MVEHSSFLDRPAMDALLGFAYFPVGFFLFGWDLSQAAFADGRAILLFLPEGLDELSHFLRC